MEEKIEIFISYADKDESLRENLENHLSTLQQQGVINVWHNRLIKAGEDRSQTIDTRLKTAKIILLLISPDFMASRYCYGKEMEYAMKRHEGNEARVIPVILRPVRWQDSPIGKLQVLPKDTTPVKSRKWHDLDEAFFDVAEGIREAIQSLPSLTGKESRHFEQMQIAIEQHERSIEGPLVPWNVPYLQNPYFTGRKSLLEQLHYALSNDSAGSAIRIRAMSGLGGVGKTQIAVEYAYRYRNEYKAVLWVRADSRETLLADFMRIASFLNLIQDQRQVQTPTNLLSEESSFTEPASQSASSVDFMEVVLPNANWYQVVGSIRQWFSTYPDWLLIFDNVNNLATIREFLPKLGQQGSILITCRMQSLGNITTRPVEVDVMDLEEGMLFLLRRAGILSLEDALDTISAKDRAVAGALVNELGGLPLALDQAGAYIQETGCSLSRYRDLYKRHFAMLLRRRGTSAEYPQSVATTWSLSFQKVEKNNPVAAEMLRLCAFLHPDAIPEELFAEEKDDLGPVLSTVVDNPIALDEAIEALRRYSLVKRNPEPRTLTIHRLVQIVLKDTMSVEQQHQRAERTIRLVNRMFPVVKRGPVDMTQWPSCEQYLPHAQVCLALSEQYSLAFLEASSLFYHVGCYLYLRGRYTEAQPFCERALTIREQLLGFEHLDVADSLDLLAAVYHKRGRYLEEEPLFKRIIGYREKTLGLEHPDLARALHGLGKCYYRQGKYAETESVLLQALSIYKKALGLENASTLSLLGVLYWEQGRYAEAEPVWLRALSIFKKDLGPVHPDVANSLTRLGLLYKTQGKYVEALPLYQQALSILEKTLGAEHRDVAISLDNLGGLFYDQGKYAEAESVWQQALSIFEKVLGPEHDHVGTSLNHLGELYVYQEKYVEAEQLFQRALTIHRRSLGIDHFRTTNDLYSLGNLYTRQEKYTEAEQLLQQAQTLYEKTLGPEHPHVADSLISLGELYQRQGKKDAAKSSFLRALNLQAKVLGPRDTKTLATQEQYKSLLE